jgi:hypothetical protein
MKIDKLHDLGKMLDIPPISSTISAQVGIQLYPDNKVPTWQLPISTLIHIYNIQ